MAPDGDWIDRVATVLAAIAAAGVAGVQWVAAAVTMVIAPAVADQPAERGDQFPLGDPPVPTTTPYVVPVADVDRAAWGTTHSSYPATDVFVDCGATLVSPVAGTVAEVRRTDSWDPDVDDPATRGGRSVAIVGDDGVRYYLAHFESIVEPLAVGARVAPGEVLGTMGDSGRTSACHLHFGISPPCPGPEWSVRRGVVWPYPYLDAWRAGEQLSPVAEVDAWLATNPTGCADAMADP